MPAVPSLGASAQGIAINRGQTRKCSTSDSSRLPTAWACAWCDAWSAPSSKGASSAAKVFNLAWVASSGWLLQAAMTASLRGMANQHCCEGPASLNISPAAASLAGGIGTGRAAASPGVSLMATPKARCQAAAISAAAARQAAAMSIAALAASAMAIRDRFRQTGRQWRLTSRGRRSGANPRYPDTVSAADARKVQPNCAVCR